MSDTVNITKPSIRVSSLAGWHDCSRRSAARTFSSILTGLGYGFGERVRNVASSFGTAQHSGIEFVNRGKMNGETPPLNEMIEVARESFREDIKFGVVYDNTTHGLNDADEQIANISRAYYYGVLPDVNPILVEDLISANIPGKMFILTRPSNVLNVEEKDGETIVTVKSESGIPVAQDFEITGHPDFIEIGAINDVKTGASGKTYHAQLGGYSVIAKARGIALPDWSNIIWIPRSTLRNPQPAPVRYVYPASLCEQAALTTIADISIQFNRFTATQNPASFPENTMSKICTPNYCTAWGTDWCPVSKTLDQNEGE